MAPSLICGIESAIAERPNALVRSAAITSIMDNVYETLAWVHGQDLHHAELVSLTELLGAAQAHQARMAAIGPAGGG